jgi:hypothetical protein
VAEIAQKPQEEEEPTQIPEEPIPDAEEESELTPEPEPELEAAPEPERETQAEVEAEPEPEPQAEAEAQPQPQPEPEAERQVEPQPEQEQEQKKEAQPEVKHVPVTRGASSHAMRPRSRGHVPTPKAHSEEPKLGDIATNRRELRRHSVFSHDAVAAEAPTPAPTRMSTRKKPPPKGDVTSAENGQKTVTKVKRANGSKNKKKKKADEAVSEADDIDPNEPRYCICDDVSYGDMISCDNNVSPLTSVPYQQFTLQNSFMLTKKSKCEKEWFHLECVGMNQHSLPGRRMKWYCPDCRKLLGTDANGNPIVPPPLPGRRGNR